METAATAAEPSWLRKTLKKMQQYFLSRTNAVRWPIIVNVCVCTYVFW